jgi:hypothetical protein
VKAGASSSQKDKSTALASRATWPKQLATSRRLLVTKKELEEATRDELVSYLESWGFACHDSETTEELRAAALQNYDTEQS